MRISLSWLGKYIDLPADADKLIQTLTFSGIEVEAVEKLPALPESVVTAKVVSASRIPETDHLMVCQVEYGGSQATQVVCGAPNCHAGMISVLALPGTELPQLTIKSARLKGVESHGMLCSERELGVSDNHAGIIELDPDTPVGVSVNGIYELPDTVLELEITPNRSDLLGYLGIARDLSASLGLPLKMPETKPVEGVPCADTKLELILEDAQKCPRYTARLLSGVTLKDSPQWLKTALVKSGLRPINNLVDVTNYVMLETGHPLHAFDYDKLLPLHAEDGHPAIVVRKARSGEEFLALDGKSYKLDENDLVIADGQRASALAGVIGGKDTAISDSTRKIVLEAASFEPMTIRSTSYKHKISTDSAYRFERQLSPSVTAQASDRAVELLLETAGGKVCHAIYDAYPEPELPRCLALRPRRFTELIGYTLESEQIITYLEALGCKFLQYGTWQEKPVYDPQQIHCHHLDEQKAGKTEFTEIDCDHALYFQIAPYRVDLTREADLIEELARLDGYDKIPRKKAVQRIMDRHAHRVRREIEDHFAQAGFCEMLNYSFSDPEQLTAINFPPNEAESKLLRLVNPQSSNQSAMRVSLLPQLLANLNYNLNHGERDLKVMEMGKLYWKDGNSYREPLHLTALLTGKTGPGHWQDKPADIGFFHVKGIAESLLDKLGLQVASSCEDQQPWLTAADNLAFYCADTLCACLGRLKSEIAEKAGIDIHNLKQDIWVLDVEVENLIGLTRDSQPRFVPLPRYPAVTRDISFVIDLTVPYAKIAAAIEAVDPRLISSVSVFDEYRGKQVPTGQRSLSLRLMLQDKEKTLTDERVEQVVASVLKMLESTWQIQMR